MPRPPRCRKISCYPDHWRFSSEDGADAEPVLLTLDEFETIRLLDHMGLTQEQCAAQMGVARTTVTAIYDAARHKLALALVDGRPLVIRGGHYALALPNQDGIVWKGEDQMRIAVTYENGQIFQHFGHTQQFKFYDVQDGSIVSQQVVDTNGSGHGALAGFLKAAQVDALICGGIGMGARNALDEAGIRLYGGVSGLADVAAAALAEGRLTYDPNVHCDHHGEGHDCGEHDCGHTHGDEGCRAHHGGEHDCGHHHGG